MLRFNFISLLFLVFNLNLFNVHCQTAHNSTDQFLTSSFKTFQSADFEMAYHILPFFAGTFYKDSASFYNPFDSLSNYISIKYSSDSLLKTYSWSERNGSCCHTSATFAQFITRSGKIDFVDLEKPNHEGVEIFIQDLQMIPINNEPHYLILGWGTCCGGKHYATARIYKVVGDSLIQCDSVFNDEKEIYIGGNRSQELGLNFDSKNRILTYNLYDLDEEIGFYKKSFTKESWQLKNKGFVKR